MSAYSLLRGPPVLPVELRATENAPLPRNQIRRPDSTRGVGRALEPRYVFGADSH